MSLADLDQNHHSVHAQEFQKPLMADEILARMRMGKHTTSEIRMGSQVIPVRVLSADEINAIRAEARANTAKFGGDETDENLYQMKLALQLASKVGTNPVPFLNDKIMQRLNLDEITYLYNELIQFWETFNPSLEQVTPERFRELVDALKKNTISWSDCSTAERKAIFTSFADLIHRQASPTSQPGN